MYVLPFVQRAISETIYLDGESSALAIVKLVKDIRITVSNGAQLEISIQ